MRKRDSLRERGRGIWGRGRKKKGDSDRGKEEEGERGRRME